MGATKRSFALVTVLLAMLVGMVPGASAATDGAIEDPAGDANGSGNVDVFVGPWLPPEVAVPSTAPVSYGPADLRRVWFSTDFSTEADETGAVEYVATGITFHVKTEEAFDPAGPMVAYNVRIPFTTLCQGDLAIQLGGGAVYTHDTENDVFWIIDDSCQFEEEITDLEGEQTYRDPRWTITAEDQEVSVSIPYESLLPWQLALVDPGSDLSGFSAFTQVEVGIYPFTDGTRRIGEFVVGQDVPQSSSSSS